MRYARDGFSVEAARKKGRPIPDDHWIHTRPPVVAHTDLFLNAYRDLSTCRPPDGPIPWTAAMAYAEHKDLGPEIAEVLWAVIWRIDLAERQWRVEDIKREAGRG